MKAETFSNRGQVVLNWLRFDGGVVLGNVAVSDG